MSCSDVAWVVLAVGLGMGLTGEALMGQDERAIPLPEPAREGEVSLEETLDGRRSVREFGDEALTVGQVGQMLWAAQGTTRGGRRTAPSAGALYPLELYLAAGAVEGVATGLYRYRPAGHDLLRVGDEDLRGALADAALGQEQIEEAPAVIVIAGVVERTAVKYGQRAVRYVHMEVGAAAENVYLQATALGLGTVYIGAFNDTRVKQLLGLPGDQQPLALLPVGRPRS